MRISRIGLAIGAAGILLLASGSLAVTYAAAANATQGLSARVSAPPAGFNPLTASAAALKAYGFPPRPTSASALAAWTQAMEHAKTYVAPSPVWAPAWVSPEIQPATETGTCSTNWAGYMDQSANNGGVAYTQTSADWVIAAVPALGGSPVPAAAFWTGIGGWGPSGSNVIDQAGTVSIANSPTPSYRMWVEDYPNPPQYVGPVISPGNTVYVSVYYEGNGQTEYYLENESTGKYTPWPASTPYYDGSSADYINEMPNGPGTLPDFGSVPFTYAQLTGGNTDGPFADFNYTKITMYSGSNCTGSVLSQPSAVGSDNESFTETWH